MRDGRFNTSKCRASFKKWGCCAHTSQSSPSPYNVQGPLKSTKKISLNYKKKKRRALSTQTAACSWRPTAGHRLLRLRSPTGQPKVGAVGGVVGGLRPLLCGSPYIQPPYPLLSTSLPPNFSTCGQLFLIGSSTCPPYPDFS
jgi:hypothetical protein